MKVAFVFACVEVGRVQRRYNVQRETLIRVGICQVRCMRKTELHLTLPAREATLKAAPRQRGSTGSFCEKGVAISRITPSLDSHPQRLDRRDSLCRQ